MSGTKEFIVSLNRGVDYDSFWDQIENESADDGFVPSRRVDIINNRDASLRICHYALTEEEANKLRNDPRVYDVEIPPEHRNDIVLKRRATQNSDFTKTTSNSGSFVNWGLRRMISESNPYGSETTAEGDFTYTLDGSGVDIVIQDSGIQADHPEFQDANGNSRVQQIDWYSASGGEIRIARRWDAGNSTDHFPGYIGLVRIYNSALTATEALARFEATRSIYGV